MKRLFLIFSVLCLVGIAVISFAEPMFVWDPSAGATGYTIYGANATTGVTQTNPAVVQDVGNVTTYPVLSLNTPPGEEWNFAVSAYNGVGESGLSNVVSFTRPAYTPPPPITLPPVQSPATVTITIQVQ